MAIRKVIFCFIVVVLLLNLHCIMTIRVVKGKTNIKIMPLGDSITRGSIGADPVSYRQKLYHDLINAGFVVDFVGTQSNGGSIDSSFDADHEGHSGWHAQQIRDNVLVWLEITTPDIILLHIGTNDISWGDEDFTEVEDILNNIDQYESNYNRDVTVILARIILRNDNSFFNEITKEFNDDVESMAQARILEGDNIVIVDMENALSYPDDIADNVHPTASGYEKMANVWYNALYNLLHQFNPKADFTASSVSGSAPLSVQFSDSSISATGIISWNWDFGDGETSNEENPTHVFKAGKFTISLTVEESDGDIDTATMSITVEPPPNINPISNFEIQMSQKPSINEEIIFIDNSHDTDGIIVSWLWTFGDGTGATIKNPIHTFSNQGKYFVTLIVEDDDGAKSSRMKEITIYDLEPPTTSEDYDGIWHTSDFTIILNATDDHSGVEDTYYKINNGPIQKLSINGQPLINAEGANNTLEFWGIDTAGNEETHNILTDIKLDKTSPNANAGQDLTINEDAVMYFNGLNSRDNIGITDYTWTVSEVVTQILDGPNPQYVFGTPGIYTANLMVADAASNSASDRISITVLDNTEPVAYAGDDQVIYERDTVIFNGSASTDNVGVTRYSWDFLDVTSRHLDGVNSSYVFETAGVYNVTLTVSDAQGNSANDTVTITVIDNTWPIANAGPDQTVDEDSPMLFDGSLSTDNVGIVNCVWTFQDGTIRTLNGVEAGYLFENPGNYSITLIVSDAEMHSTNDTILIVVRDITAPNIEVESHETVIEETSITFNASKSYDNVGIVNFHWIFGDGASENTSNPICKHIYTEPGEYIMELIATDVNGNNNTTSKSITVYRDTDGDLIPNYLDPDDDNDGIPDEWELSYELDPLNESDALEDPDGDGIHNLEEYLHDGDPRAYDFSFILSILLVIAVILSMISFGILYSRNLKRKEK